jgi:putative tributyrin esterase
MRITIPKYMLLATLLVVSAALDHALVCGNRVLAQRRQTSSPTRVETIQFQSSFVGRMLPYNVILPLDYRVSHTTRYPVLYLLHGLGGHHTDWLTRTNVADYAAQYRMIVVTPEGNDSWYVDSGGVPSDKYETYILKELIPDVDKRFRTIQSRYGRAVAGLSMGGYGAIKYGLKYPATFVFAGSMSGAFGVTRYTQNEIGGKDWGPFLKTFGPDGSETRKANDVFEIARGLTPARAASLPYFYFDCGTEDAAQHFNPNRELSQIFLEKKIAHEYRELPGGHSWAYWDQQVQEVLKIAAQKMRLPHSSSRNRRISHRFSRRDTDQAGNTQRGRFCFHLC